MNPPGVPSPQRAHRHPIVDTHQHLWDLSRFRLPWLEAVPALDHSCTPQDYAAATAGAGVPLRTVYMEVDVADDQRADELAYVSGLCAEPDSPMAAAVVSGRPSLPDFAGWVRTLADHPHVRGVRQVLHGAGTPAGTCLQPAFLHGVRLLGEAGLSFGVCLRPGELGDAERLAAACPDTLLILDHCGNADPVVVAGMAPPPGQTPAHDADAWRRHIDALAERANVISKISGIAARAPSVDDLPGLLGPTVEHCLDAFGPDRVVFGGDWPVCTLGASWQQWLDALRAIIASRPDDEQARLLHANAERFYQLA